MENCNKRDYVSIEGIPGTGKSTLLCNLVQDVEIRNRFELITEPVASFQNSNGIDCLGENVYENPSKNGILTQNIFLDIANEHHTKK